MLYLFFFPPKKNKQYFKWYVHYFLTGDQQHRKRSKFWRTVSIVSDSKYGIGHSCSVRRLNNFLSLDRKGNFKFFQKRFSTRVLSWCNLGLESKYYGDLSDVVRYWTGYLFFAPELAKKRCIDQPLLCIILWHWIYSLWILKQNVITFHLQHCLTSMVSQITQTCNAMNKIIRLINTRLCNGLCLLLAWE